MEAPRGTGRALAGEEAAMFGKVIEGGTRALDFFLRRHALVAQNLAHIETPNYRAQDLDFGAALDTAFREAEQGGAVSATTRATAPGHFPAPNALRDGIVVTDPSTPAGRDGNSVDIDRESAKLSENALRYDATTRIVAHRLAMLQNVVTEGGR